MEASTKLFLRTVGRFVQEKLDRVLHPLLAREAEHVARIKALEENQQAMQEMQKAQRYRGTWDATTVYFAGNRATHDGSEFHCNIDGTQQRPGKGGDWQLATKRGKDGKVDMDELRQLVQCEVERQLADLVRDGRAAA